MYIFYHTYASYCAIICVTASKICNLRRLSHQQHSNCISNKERKKKHLRHYDCALAYGRFMDTTEV